jgi:predicted metal-dependent phosphoesterase TrpH
MIDLHVHSCFSDGTQSPEEIVGEAAAAGLSAVALTDHDTCGGCDRFLAACAVAGIEGVAGVELSAETPGERGTMHILGYFIDPSCPGLVAELRKVQASRVTRNDRILELLRQEGVQLSRERVEHFAGGEVTGRLHVALALVEAGVVTNRDAAFKKYLAKGKSCYVERYRLSPQHCIALIREAGGVAVLAHPCTLRATRAKLRRTLAQLAGWGLGGVEVVYPQHDDQQLQRYRGVARELGLCETGGTDYHGNNTPDIYLGRGFGGLRVPDALLPALKSRAVAISPGSPVRS